MQSYEKSEFPLGLYCHVVVQYVSMCDIGRICEPIWYILVIEKQF